MKNVLAALAVVLLPLSLAGCGESDEGVSLPEQVPNTNKADYNMEDNSAVPTVEENAL